MLDLNFTIVFRLLPGEQVAALGLRLQVRHRGDQQHQRQGSGMSHCLNLSQFKGIVSRNFRLRHITLMVRT